MILVLIFLGITIFLMLLILVLIMSTLRIDIKQLSISNIDENLIKRNLGINYKICVGLYLFNKIKIMWITLKNGETKDNKLFKIFRMFKIYDKNIKSVVKKRPSIKEIVKGLRILDFKFRKINLSLVFDTEDVIVTTTIITIVSSLIAFIFAKTIKCFDKNKHSYIIKPLYINKNIIKINLNCIICIKMVHIIHMYIKVRGKAL